MQPTPMPSRTIPSPLWFVTLTVAGDDVPTIEIKSGLERLSHEHPFLLSGRYAANRAEIRYWEEAPMPGRPPNWHWTSGPSTAARRRCRTGTWSPSR